MTNRYYAMVEIDSPAEDGPDEIMEVLGNAIDGANEDGLTCRIVKMVQEV